MLIYWDFDYFVIYASYFLRHIFNVIYTSYKIFRKTSRWGWDNSPSLKWQKRKLRFLNLGFSAFLSSWKNKRIEYALYKMGIRTGGKISLFFGIHQRTKKINAIRLIHSFFSSFIQFFLVFYPVFSRLIVAVSFGIIGFIFLQKV